MSDTTNNIIDETGETIRYSLRYRPVPFLILVSLVLIACLFSYYLYLDDKHYRMNTELTNSTMSAQNKILLENNELKKIEIKKLDELISLTKKRR